MNDMPAPKETDDFWIDVMLEKEGPSWKDTPITKKKNSDDYEDLMELLEDIE